MFIVITILTAILLSLSAWAEEGTPTPLPPSSQATAIKAEDTAEVVLSNDRLRLRFHPGQPRFGIFPRGYTGYTLELRDGDEWVPMAKAAYFSAYVYRSGWGRDWLHYVIPEGVEIRPEGEAATVLFSAHQVDLDRVGWHFTFSFTLRPGKRTVDVTSTARVDDRRELLLFWGPRLYAGEGSFGGTKDEALFPGLEYLGPQDRSSGNPALAPDARMYFVPHPAKITIPLMAVVRQGRMVGLTWDPLQKWNGTDTGPSALFASPNWIEGRDNHLLGLFLPNVPRYVAENGFRAHTPAVIEAGQTVSLTAQLFTAPAEHAVEAVDLYLAERGGLPAPVARPMDDSAALEMLVQALTTTAWNPETRGWPGAYGGAPSPNPVVIVSLQEAASLLRDPELAQRARQVAQEALSVQPGRTLALALRVGGLERALRWEQSLALDRLRQQQPDGAWLFTPTEVGEGGLRGLMGPPEPGTIACAGDRSQGITAGHLAPLWEYVLVFGDQDALEAARRGLEDLDRYAIPFVYEQQECPPAPALHGSYYALRSYLTAYRITGERRYLERAVYWAKTGLPFLYLWSRPAQVVERGQVHTAERIFLSGDKLYRETRRDPMLYGALYGYGSSQFLHHWYGLLVPWIGLTYARDLDALAEVDRSLPWRRIVEGILASALWQTYDQPPFTGYLPDAFSLETWVPSGPAISPRLLLDTLLACVYGQNGGTDTVVLREGTTRCHLTSAATIGEPEWGDGVIRFTLDDPDWNHCRAVLAGLAEPWLLTADGQPLPQVKDLEEQEEGWSLGPGQLILLKVRQQEHPRRIEARSVR